MKSDLTNAFLTLALCGLVSAAGCAGNPSAGSETSPAPAGPREDAVTAETMGIDRTHYENVVEMLRGQVPGLEILEPAPGRIEVRIRGMTQSLQTNAEGAPVGQEPLVVVDGVPRSRPAGEVLMSLNPKDVASISVLKDVASTAIYGTKGANGVILVRMRRTT